ncbi:WxcM-like domain-containing protein [Candidatus Peregrinibacteria bacterium]|nr:WxcM-like domain-containing protein [Candidatus Peregrinibacteria bacterium]
MNKIKEIKLNSFKDERGTLTAVEMKDYIDWPVKRIYYLTDVSKPRGGHAVRHEKKMYVCQKGNVKARFHDGEKWHQFEMYGPSDAILMEAMCFREFYDFSPDCILLAISSVSYLPDDYIYDLDEFIKEVNK